MLKSKFVRFLLLIGVYFGVKHYSGHNCLAISAVCALLYLSGNKEKPAVKKSMTLEEIWERNNNNWSGRA